MYYSPGFQFVIFFTHCFYISVLFCCKCSKFSNESLVQFQGTMLLSHASLFAAQTDEVMGNVCTAPADSECQL